MITAAQLIGALCIALALGVLGLGLLWVEGRVHRLEHRDTPTDAGLDIVPEPRTEPITDDGYYQRIRHIGEHRKGR